MCYLLDSNLICLILRAIFNRFSNNLLVFWTINVTVVIYGVLTEREVVETRHFVLHVFIISDPPFYIFSSANVNTVQTTKLSPSCLSAVRWEEWLFRGLVM